MIVNSAQHVPALAPTSTPGVYGVYCPGCSEKVGHYVFRCTILGTNWPGDKLFASADFRTTVLRMQRQREVKRNVVQTPANARDTTAAAAASKLPRSGTQRLRVYELIKSHGGLTDYEIEEFTGMTHQSASAARNSLMNDGFIIATDERRLTQTGNKAIVWKVV